jgi:hypothetical protein
MKINEFKREDYQTFIFDHKRTTNRRSSEGTYLRGRYLM